MLSKSAFFKRTGKKSQFSYGWESHRKQYFEALSKLKEVLKEYDEGLYHEANEVPYLQHPDDYLQHIDTLGRLRKATNNFITKIETNYIVDPTYPAYYAGDRFIIQSTEELVKLTNAINLTIDLLNDPHNKIGEYHREANRLQDETNSTALRCLGGLMMAVGLVAAITAFALLVPLIISPLPMAILAPQLLDIMVVTMASSYIAKVGRALFDAGTGKGYAADMKQISKETTEALMPSPRWF